MAGQSRIKGITIELDGETRGLDKAIEDVTRKSIDLQGELRDVERLLKFDPGNSEALAQKQLILSKQLENTVEKLNRLKAAQAEVERQFESGDIGEKQYRAFRREIEFTEKSIKDLKSKISQLDGAQVTEVRNDFNQLEESVEEATNNVESLGGELTNLAAGAGAVIGIGEVIEKSLDTSSLNTKIDVSFNVPEESKASIKEAVNQVQVYGVDAEEALEGVRRQWALNKEASDEANAATVKYASRISNTYSGIDFTELIQESNEVAKIFNISNEEALALMDTLMELGFPPDQIDIIAEYGHQLQMAGYNAEEAMGIFASGVATGTQNIDQLIDGIKEGRIVMAEFGAGIDEETAKLVNSVGISTEQFQAWGKTVANGGADGKKAMEEVASALVGIEDKTIRNQIGTKIFGTLFEEQGTKITDAILGANDHMLDMGGMIDSLNEKTARMDEDPMVKLKQASLDLMTALAPLLSVIADIIGKIAEWVSNNSTLAGIIVAIAGAIGIIVGICMVLAPIITTLSGIAAIFGTTLGAIAAPVLLVVAAIAGLIAIGVALWQNWDTIKAKCIEIWEAIKVFLSEAWENIKSTAVTVWENIKNSVVTAWESIKNFFTETIPNLINSIINWFNELPYKIGYALGQLLGTIFKWGYDTGTYLRTNVPIWIENVVTFFSELPGKIGTWLVNTYNNIVKWGKDTYTSMKNAAYNAIIAVIDWFKNLPGRIWSFLMNTISNAYQFGRDLGASAREAGSKFINNIVDIVKNLPSRMKTIGSNIVRGVWEGISGMWGWITGKVGNFFNGIVDGVKSVLKINSPSKVFIGIGGSIGEGLVDGINNMKRVVANAGQAMAEASIPRIKQPSFIKNLATNTPIELTVVNENIIDGSRIVATSKKQTISEINRSSKNYAKIKGRVNV